MSEDIVELQEELAHQSLTISRLSDELYAQQREILQLKKQLSVFKETVESLSNLRSEDEEAAPPHY